MTKEQFDAWIAEQGGPLAVQYSTENVTVPNPAYNADDVIGSATGTQVPKTITIQVQKWVNKKTGAALTVKPGAGDQQYEVVSQTGAAPTDSKTAEPPPTRPKPEDPTQYQEWDSERRVWVDKGALGQKPKDAPGLGQHGAVVSAATEQRDGKVVKVTKYEDGFEQVVSEPDAPKPLGQHGAIVSDATEKREGKSVRVTKYEDGFEAVASVTEETGVDEPPGAPPLDLTPGNGMTSLVTYKSWLEGQAGLTRAQKAALVQGRIDLVLAAAKEQAGVAGISLNVMGEQGAEARSERGQANTRLSESQGTYRGALDYIMQTSKFQGRNGPKASSVMDEILGRAKSFAQEMGGLTNTPRNPVPTQLAPYYTVPGQAAGGAPPAGGPAPAPPMAPMPAPPPIQPQPAAPQVGPQPLYAPPASMQAGPAPGPPVEMPTQQPGGQFAEMVEIMRRAGMDQTSIDMANNIAIANMLGGGW